MTHRLQVGRAGRNGPHRLPALYLATCLAWAGCSGGGRDAPLRNGTETETTGAAAANEPTSIAFRDATAEWGVEFTHRNGERDDAAPILEIVGGGVAIRDFDGDGWNDLFFTGGGSVSLTPAGRRRSALFLNRPAGGGPRFVDAAAQAGLDDDRLFSHGVAAADLDEDGFTDLLVTGWEGVQLWRNQGDGTFSEAAVAAGLEGAGWCTSAACGDLNGDGCLDLYLARYVDWGPDNDPPCTDPTGQLVDNCAPFKFSGLPDRLYFSNGDGTFRDGAREAGLRTDGKGLGVVLCDLDGNGTLDIYVANDGVANFLYLNDGTGRLTERGVVSGAGLDDVGAPDGSMGVEAGDLNRDGRVDLFAANFENEAFALYRNIGNGQFLPWSRSSGITAQTGAHVGWGTVFGDFDQDGDLDIFVANGHAQRHPRSAPRLQRNLLFEQRPGPWFADVALQAGDCFQPPRNGRGAAAGDLDGDGDLDLAISYLNTPVAVLENVSDGGGARNHGLRLRLIGRSSPRDAHGARIELLAGKVRQIGLVRGGGSYLSTHERELHFGLGTAEQADRVVIRWPSGTVQELRDVAVGTTMTVVEPSR